VENWTKELNDDAPGMRLECLFIFLFLMVRAGQVGGVFIVLFSLRRRRKRGLLVGLVLLLACAFAGTILWSIRRSV